MAEPTMTEYNVYVEGEFVETLTRAEIMKKYKLNDKQFNNRVCGGSNRGTRGYKIYFGRIYCNDSKSNIPTEVLEDWEETRMKILEIAKNRRKKKKERLIIKER